ncbi:hypothetical protein GN956_G18365 [Arapaima gigas]
MNTTTQSPNPTNGDLAISYVLVPFFLMTVAGICSLCGAGFDCRCRWLFCCRVDRLRHQLLPVYTYDPSEELNEAEQELLWKEEDTKVG